MTRKIPWALVHGPLSDSLAELKPPLVFILVASFTRFELLASSSVSDHHPCS